MPSWAGFPGAGYACVKSADGSAAAQAGSFRKPSSLMSPVRCAARMSRRGALADGMAVAWAAAEPESSSKSAASRSATRVLVG